MRLEVLNAWLAALRSGEFPQGVGQLVRLYDDGSREYCCLGVLCELARRDRVPLEVEDVPNDNAGGGLRTFDGDQSYLPVAVQRWAGLDEQDPRVDPTGNGTLTLSALNDASATFTSVIDVLERWRRELGS